MAPFKPLHFRSFWQSGPLERCKGKCACIFALKIRKAWLRLHTYGTWGDPTPHESPSLMADRMLSHQSIFSMISQAHFISNGPVQRSIMRSYACKHPTSLHDLAPLHPHHLPDFHPQPLGAYKRLHCVSYREGCKSHRIELMKVC